MNSILLPSEMYQNSYKEVRFSEIVSGKKVNFRLLKGIEEIPSLQKITSAAVVPFTKKDTMVATALHRGLDIPGGHTEEEDKGLIGTIRREAQEETCISLEVPLYLIGIISSDYKGSEAENITYMVITAGKVQKVEPFSARFESLGREIVSVEDFLNRYNAGSQAMMKEIITRSRAFNDEFFS